MRELALRGVNTTIFFDKEVDSFLLDLNTQAKSHLCINEDGILTGRYDYRTEVCLDQDLEEIIRLLCHEFKHAQHGRNYGNQAWKNLCDCWYKRLKSTNLYI
jgi:hypothetical protein